MKSSRFSLSNLIPSIQWLSQYTTSLFKKDLAAGLNVLVILLPQGMAYALLAGVPPVYGLYAGLLPLVVYAFLGTSMHLSIGPAAISSILILEGISRLAVPESADFIKYVLLTGLIVGLIQWLAGVARFSFWIKFLSRPVILGFTCAAAIVIGTSQLKYLFGMNIPRFSSLWETYAYTFSNSGNIHWITVLICLGGIGLIYLLKKIHKAIPGGLIAAIIAIILTLTLSLESTGVEIIGELPSGLPSFNMLSFTLEDVKLVFPTALVLAFFSTVECVSIAKYWPMDKRFDFFDTNKELVAYGLSKIAGAFFQALPASASNSRSAVNFTSGAQTQMSSIISAIFMSIVLLQFSNLFYYLPKAILASIILLAVTQLFNYKEVFKLKEKSQIDFWLAIFTFVATLTLGVKGGILLGMIVAALVMFYQKKKVGALLKSENE